MDFNAIKNDPVLMAAALAALAALGKGVKMIWDAFVAMTVRSLDQVAPAHVGDRQSLVHKVRSHEDRSTPRRKMESLMITRMPEAVIEEAMKLRKRREERSR